MPEELTDIQKSYIQSQEEKRSVDKAIELNTTQSLDSNLNLDAIKQTDALFKKDRDYAELGREANFWGEIFGWTGEVGFGMYGSSKNLKNAPLFLKGIDWAKKTKNLSKVGVLAPDPYSKFGTVPLWLLSEAAVWGGANAVGQWMRSTFSNHNFSVGELGSATLFGMAATPVMTKAQKTLSLIGTKGAQREAIKLSGLSLSEMKLFQKTPLKRKLADKYGIPFITGAAFGMGEMALREELEVLMNERENKSTWSYLLASGAIGGTANGLFKAFGATKWGRNQVSEAMENAVEKTQKNLDELEKSLNKALTSKEPKNPVNKRHLQESIEIKKQAFQDTKGALAFLTESLENIKKENYKMEVIQDAPPVSQKDIKDALDVEAVPTQRERSDLGDEVVEVIDAAPKDLIKKTKKVDETKTDEGIRKLNESDVDVVVKARDLSSRLEDEIESLSGAYNKSIDEGNVDQATGEKLLKFLDDKIELDTKVLDPYKIFFGRGLRGLRKDAELFLSDVPSEYSVRAIESQRGWKNLRDALKKSLDEETPFTGIMQRLDDLDVVIKGVQKKGVAKGKAITRLGKGRKQVEATKLIENKIKSLEKQIQKQKDLEKAPEVADKIKRPKAKKTPEILKLEQELNFQKKLTKEAEKFDKAQKQLNRLLGMTPEEFAKLDANEQAKRLLKPKGAKTKSDTLKDEIKAVKTKLRKSAKELEKKSEKAKHMEFYESLRDAYLASLWKSKSNWMYKTTSRLTTMRQLAFIDQMSSVVAGVPTGMWAVAKHTVVRPLSTGLVNIGKTAIGRQSKTKTKQLILNEIDTIAEFFKDIGTALKAGKMRAKTLAGVTDASADGKIKLSDDEMPLNSYSRTVVNSHKDAKTLLESKNRFTEWIAVTRNTSTRQLLNILTLGYRGIVAVDEVFYRQLVKANVHRAAGTKAILESPDDLEKQFKIKKEFIDSSWEKRSSGISALKETDDNFAAIHSIRQDMFYSLNKPDNGDIMVPWTEGIIKGLKAFSDTNAATKFATYAVMPFMNIAIRGVGLSARTTFGAVTFPFKAKFNIYNKKINEAKQQIKGLETEIVIQQKANNKEAVKASEDFITKLKQDIKLNEARRLEHNAEEMSYALMGGAAFAYAYKAASENEGLVTGSLSWMTDAQRRNAEREGVKPFTMKTPFGKFDYRYMLPFSIPLAFGADWSGWDQAKEKGTLGRDKTFIDMMSKSMGTLVMEMPFNQGLKSAQQIVLPRSTQEWENAVTDMATSYVPVPAQIKKLGKLYTGENKVDSLKGGSWDDRVLYHLLGVSTPNKRVDIFGDFIISSKNIYTELGRIAPLSDTSSSFTEYNKVAALDSIGGLPTELPKTLYAGIDMEEFLDEEGLTLKSEFARRLRESDIKEKVSRIIATSGFQKFVDVEEGTIATSEEAWLNKETNKGFQKLRSVIEKSYKNERAKIIKEIKRGDFGKNFINREGESLYDLLKNTQLNKTTTTYKKVLNLGRF